MGDFDDIFEYDYDSDMSASVISAILSVIFWVLVAYMIYYCCCRKRRNQGTVFTTVQAVPVTTTTVQHGNMTAHTTVMPTQGGAAIIGHTSSYPVQGAPVLSAYPPPQQPYQSAMPYPQNTAAPYPGMQQQQQYPVMGTGMPQPYGGGQQAPYPTGMPQPYGAAQAAYPPSYDQVVGQEGYQKQAPFNPHYAGN